MRALLRWTTIGLLGIGSASAQVFEKATPAERELLQRALGISETTQFLPGRLTDEVRRALGLRFLGAPDLSVVGSVVYGAPSEPLTLMRAYFISRQGEVEVRRAIESGLSQDGWQSKYPNAGAGPRNAFASASFGTPITTYCKGERNLNFYMFPAPSGTNVTISVSRDPSNSPCPMRFGANNNVYSPARPPTEPDPFANWPLPRLAAPANATVWESGSSLSSSFAKDIATISASGRTAVQVFDHYVAELGKAGWRLTGRRVAPNGEHIAGFNFRFDDRELQGRLSMTPRKDDPGRFDVQLESFGR